MAHRNTLPDHPLLPEGLSAEGRRKWYRDQMLSYRRQGYSAEWIAVKLGVCKETVQRNSAAVRQVVSKRPMKTNVVRSDRGKRRKP